MLIFPSPKRYSTVTKRIGRVGRRVISFFSSIYDSIIVIPGILYFESTVHRGGGEGEGFE